MEMVERFGSPVAMESGIRLRRDAGEQTGGLYERVGIRLARKFVGLRGLVIAERIGGIHRRKLSSAECAEYRRVVSYVAERRAQIRNQAEFLEREKKETLWEAREIQYCLEGNLSNQGFDYFFSREGERYRQKTHVEFIQVTPDEFRYKIDGATLPHGVNMLEMTDESVVKTIAAAVGLQVEAHLDEGGLWFRCYRNTGIRNIPRYVTYEQVTAMPRKAGLLVIPIGLKANRKLATIDLDHDTTAHMIVAGSPGGGKSTILHSLICSVMQQNPADVKLILVDLKRMEFKRYSHIPHLAQPIVLDIEKVLPLIGGLYEECKRRMELLESDRGYNHINLWNRKNPGMAIPHIVAIFDEIARIMLDPTVTKKFKDEFESYAAQIAQLGRALGVHLILSTQRPEESVLRPLIRASFNLRIATACAAISDSKLIVQNGDACFRDAVPPGRCIMNSGRWNTPLQAAYISQQAIDDLITVAESGELRRRKMAHDVHLQDLIEWALREWQELPVNHPAGAVGTIARYPTKAHFSLRAVPHADVDWMLEDGKRGFIYKEHEYRLADAERLNAPGVLSPNKPLWIIDIQLEKEQLQAQAAQAAEPEIVEPPPLTIKEKRERAAADLARFIASCDLDPNLFTPSADLAEAYSRWMKEHNIEFTATPQQFGVALRRASCVTSWERQNGKVIRGWVGIRPPRATHTIVDAEYAISSVDPKSGDTVESAEIRDTVVTQE